MKQGPGRDEFLERFYAANRPIVLDEVVRDMPAAAWTPALLRERCGDVEIENPDIGGFPHYERIHTTMVTLEPGQPTSAAVGHAPGSATNRPFRTAFLKAS